MADDVSLIVGVDYKEMTGFIKTSGQTKRVLKEIAKEFSKTGDHSRWMSSINAVVKADHKLAESAKLGQKEIMKLGYAMRNEAKFTDALTASTKRLTAAQTTSNKVMQQSKSRMNGNNMAIQQLGYQFGDFAVQVQGGTSAFVAFSQQGAQLAGILPMIAGPLGLSMGAAVGLSAALGILIPVGSAVGRMFFEMTTGSEASKDALDRFSQALDAIEPSATIATSSLEDLREEYGRSAEAVKHFSRLVLQAQVDSSLSAMGETIDPFSKKISKAARTIEYAMDQIATRKPNGSGFVEAFQKEIKEVSESLGILPDDIKKLGDAFNAINSSVELPDIESSTRAALDLIENLSFEGKRPTAITDAILALSKVHNDVARAQKSLVDADQGYVADNSKTLSKALKESLSAMRGLTSFGDKLELNLVKANAEVEALKNGGDAANESMIAGLMHELRLRYEIAMTTSQDDAAKAQVRRDYETALSRLQDLKSALAEKEKLLADQKAAKKAAKDVAKDAAAALKALGKAEKDAAKAAKKAAIEVAKDAVAALKKVAKAEKDAARAAKKAAKDLQKIYESSNKARVYMSRAAGVQMIADAQAVTSKRLAGEEGYLKAIEKALESGKGLSELDLKSPFESSLVAARELANTMKISLVDALNLINLASPKSTVVGAGRGLSTGAGSTNGERLMLRMGGETSEPYKKTKVGGGSSSNVIDINEIIEARKLQIEQDRVLIGLSGEQHEAQRIYYELLKENEEADVQVTETKLKNSADYIAAKLEENRILEEATAQQNDLAQSIANSMGDAFTSIVDGTKSVKDAFKDMAKAVIKQLFEVLVVQRLVGSVGVGDKAGSGLAGWLSGTLQADGGAWQGGSQIQAYANGGVVGSPTTFPMAGGKTGLMGEAGPEAIMPLKRGANGKLGVQMEGGGGDNVVIHQNFNFQANGDESVKKLIAQAAPQIANMTKSSMLNDRRRGGATKAVFG